jgi:hypothetical protein
MGQTSHERHSPIGRASYLDMQPIGNDIPAQRSVHRYPSCAEEREDEELAERVQTQKDYAKRLQNILQDAIFRIERLDHLKLWPAEGWDYHSTTGALLDLMPHRTDAQIEAFAREEGP